MKPSLPAMLLLSAASAIASAPAQAPAPVKVTGVVQPVPGPTICLQGETHRLGCTNVYLKSNVVDLDALVGQNVEVTGFDVGLTCNVVNVTSAAPPIPFLEWCGTPQLGCTVKFKVCPGGLGFAWLFLADAPGYLPINPVTGTVLLFFVPPPILVGSGPVGAGCLEVVVPIPFDGNLIGQEFHLQGARMDIGPVGPLQLTNAACLTITPFLPPCGPINC
ncbi:MAG: hypothetical protein L0323_02845 [Planctomycetes bacterium]|nr:hypothetical protein [Planctomycetota bacterium]